ncbi:MAG: QueT transporter family protein [Romboutsia sp.]|nr:QueT transporter family protein [Romboutsia sp.]
METSNILKRVGVPGLIKIALTAAIYVVVTLVFSGISYGPIQARPSELLNFLAFIDPLYVVGLTLGCAISNLYSFGLIDVIVGSLATLISTYLMYKSKSLFVATLWPTIINAIFVAAELFYVAQQPFWFNCLTVGIGEFLIMTIIGYPLFKFVLFKNKHFVEAIRIDLNNKTYLKKLKSI